MRNSYSKNIYKFLVRKVDKQNKYKFPVRKPYKKAQACVHTLKKKKHKFKYKIPVRILQKNPISC